jgi:hypothetical protein
MVKQINVKPFQLNLLGSMKIHSMFHVSLLELYHAFTKLRRIYDPPPPIEIDGEHEYEVEDILELRISNRQFQYLIHSCGYDVRTQELRKRTLNVQNKHENGFLLC